MIEKRFAAHALTVGVSFLRKLAAISVGAWLIGSTASCLLLSNRDKDQCSTTSDCTKKGSRFAGSQCVAGLCLQQRSGEAVGQCSTTADCLAAPESPNTYCSAQKSCEPILDSNCTAIVTNDGKPLTPNTILLGVLAPLTGPNATDGQARVRAVQLAHSEFYERAVGIPIGAGTAPRPVALVVCDQVADADAAATHLAVDLRVPAIIGPGFSGTTVKVAKNVTVPNGTLLISPSATTPDLTTLQDNGLVWRTAASFEPESKAYADVVAQMEAHPVFRSQLNLDSSSGTQPLKVAVLAKGDSYGKGLANLLASTLHYNGKTNAFSDRANYAGFDLPDLSTTPGASTQDIVASIVQNFKPHLILAIGTAEVIVNGLIPIEDQWITGSGAQPRPFYLFSEGAKLTQLAAAVAASESAHQDRNLKMRVSVFGPRYNDTLYGLLQSRYSAANNHEPMPDVYGVTGSYDAFYLIAYALTASQSAQPTGATVAEGLKRTVPPAMTISAGPSDVSRAIAQLLAGQSIDYSGVTGPLDFDISTGESPGDYNLYCVSGTEFVATGQYYLSGELRLVGDYAPCP